MWLTRPDTLTPLPTFHMYAVLHKDALKNNEPPVVVLPTRRKAREFIDAQPNAKDLRARRSRVQVYQT